VKYVYRVERADYNATGDVREFAHTTGWSGISEEWEPVRVFPTATGSFFLLLRREKEEE
jgi:hypothetical protein